MYSFIYIFSSIYVYIFPNVSTLAPSSLPKLFGA